MSEAQVSTHTLQSHGVKLAKTHMHDWIIIALLVIVLVVLDIIHPFYRYIGKDMMTDFKYPHKSNTIEFWAVLIVVVLLPVVIFIVLYLYRKDVYDLHHATLGILFSGLITGIITDAIKIAVGRPRPDFFWRCFPDGKELYDQVTGNVVCHGDRLLIKDGHKSFPSGHTSWSFAGLGFLALYLSGKVRVFDRKGHAAKLCIVLLPLLLASFVGISRLDDYRHHWQDVFAGGLLGWGPYAYFHMLEEARSSSSTAANTVNQQAETSDTAVPSQAHGNGTLDLESGRR